VENLKTCQQTKNKPFAEYGYFLVRKYPRELAPSGSLASA